MSQKIAFPEWVELVEKTGQDKAALAEELRIRPATLYRYLDRTRIPQRDVMDRILSRSGGTVDVAWFFTKAEASAS